ncbi:hypothetical protein LY90DRAFT_68232 [Neocallimastix californiae]|jgi:hypothetical protein|uniref:Retrotransposon gag domain-containing protein n=1 Tax=Neocallimastix californiae TaxID=1754190 RepID=A0A1Y2BH92_9FUNG|nr:hypothetical protein LY90DRAFT_68232 [Neocallimastix californiae]|eukprot:ORY34136.1 hypothetical protein LY90DRAFT_68232 [Neocallimastix californiae]
MIQNTDNVNKSEVKEDVSCTIDKENNRVQYLEQMCEKLSKTVDELSQQLKEIQINNTSTEKKTTSSNTETDNTNNNNVQIKYVYMNPPTPKYTFDGRDGRLVYTFIGRCRSHLKAFSDYYNGDERKMLNYVEEGLQGSAAYWYFTTQSEKQYENPNVEQLFKELVKSFYLDSIEDNNEIIAKIKLSGLEQNWENTDEYLYEFSILTKLLKLDDSTKKKILYYQVRPSIRQVLYPLLNNKNWTSDDFIDQIVKCQVHSYYYYAFNLEENYYGREFKSEIRKLLNIDTNTYDNHGSYFDQYQEYYQNMYNGSEGSFDSEEESEYQSQGIDDHEVLENHGFPTTTTTTNNNNNNNNNINYPFNTNSQHIINDKYLYDLNGFRFNNNDNDNDEKSNKSNSESNNGNNNNNNNNNNKNNNNNTNAKNGKGKNKRRKRGKGKGKGNAQGFPNEAIQQINEP